MVAIFPKINRSTSLAKNVTAVLTKIHPPKRNNSCTAVGSQSNRLRKPGMRKWLTTSVKRFDTIPPMMIAQTLFVAKAIEIITIAVMSCEVVLRIVIFPTCMCRLS